MEKKYYKILEVSENATPAEIRKAYQKLVLIWHPDKKPGDKEAETKTKELNEAYEVLSDESKKAQYDNGQNASVEKYGYDYGEEVAEGAVGEHSWKGIEEVLRTLGAFYTYGNTWEREVQERGEELKVIGDYHLVRGKKFLQLLHSYYTPIVKEIGWEKFYEDYCSIFKSHLGLSWMSYTEGWEKSVERFKRELNFARKKLGLDPLTENDLKLKPIEGKIPNETPQIPDGKKPKPIKDGVADIEKYNKSFDEVNNETVRKFWELRDKIYNETEDFKRFQKVNPSLFEQMDNQAKEAEKGTFLTIWNTDEETKISEIKTFNNNKLSKMSEVIKLMEKLIAEGKNSEEQNNSVISEPRGKKREFESEARQEKEKKSKIVADELSRLISEAESKNNYGELETVIKEIDKLQGEEEYISHQEKIDQLKIKLGKLDKDKFRQLTIKKIEDLMKDNKLEKSELDQEAKEELESLKNENDVNKINELENKLGEKIGKKGALNSLSKLLEEAKNLVKSAAKNATEELLKQAERIKKDLYSFKFSTNGWKTNACQNSENELNSVLNQLESFSTQTAQKPKSVFSRPEIMVPVALVAVLGIVGVSVVIAKNKKRKQAKVE